jgi:hypothetical protein
MQVLELSYKQLIENIYILKFKIITLGFNWSLQLGFFFFFFFNCFDIRKRKKSIKLAKLLEFTL